MKNAPSARPLVMTPINIRLLIALRKWETRRLVTIPDHWQTPENPFHCRRVQRGGNGFIFYHARERYGCLAPPWAPGDTAWIQENYRIWIRDSSLRTVVVHYPATDTLAERVQLTDKEFTKLVERDRPPRHWRADKDDGTPVTPARFMYRSLARLEKNVAASRGELLHKITDVGAEAEGMIRDRPLACLFDICGHSPKLNIGALAADDPKLFIFGEDRKTPTDYEKVVGTTARGAYAALWEALHGPGAWIKNPPVWVITFER